MTLDESVHDRLRVIERAQVQGNVSAVCREAGDFADGFLSMAPTPGRYGVDGVHPRRQRARRAPRGGRRRKSSGGARIAISAATGGADGSRPTWRRTWRVRVAPSTVQRLLRRVGLARAGPG